MKIEDFTFENIIDDDNIIKNENNPLNLGNVKKNIPSFSSHKLCEMIVCERYFNFNLDVSIYCMEELAKRRENGDVFDFENYIDNAYQELPQLNLNIPDLRVILSQIINVKIKK